MNRKERLHNTLAGKPVDRPAVCFYELNGLDQDPDDKGEFNIFSHPSWKPAIDLAREKSDRIVLRGLSLLTGKNGINIYGEMASVETWSSGISQFTRTTIQVSNRKFTQLTRRDLDVDTIWELEHFLKDVDDLKEWLNIPLITYNNELDLQPFISAEEKIGDSGIVGLDTGDPLLFASQLFDMATFTMIATFEPKLFQQTLEKFYYWLMPQIQMAARALPGKMWRIFGPEYATPPYLNPQWFKDYVVRFDTAIVEAIHSTGGYARIHCHGKIKKVLDGILATGCDGMDPIEPPPQGDVELAYVRQHYGQQLVLFGNLEASDLENLSQEHFRIKVQRALTEGTQGSGRGFVLMPSSIPYGRVLTITAMKNFEVMVDEVEKL